MTFDRSKILLISYLFPPAGGVGTPRAISYARYLPQFGCEVIVLTASNPATPLQDPTLIRLVPENTLVRRAFNPEVSYQLRDKIWKYLQPPGLVNRTEARRQDEPALCGAIKPLKDLFRWSIERTFCPDVQKVWVPFARRAAFDLIRRYSIGTVLVNLPPFSQMEIGLSIKSKFPEIRLIGDFRDDWRGYSLVRLETAVSEYKAQYAERLEGDFVRAADYISAVTSEQTTAIRDRYEGVDKAKFFCMPNGFEPELFRDFTPRPHNQGRIIVTYLGTVYANSAYSPDTYLDALDNLPEQLRDRIETRFIGRVAKEAAPLLKNRRTVVREYGFLPKDAGIRMLEESDYLLVIARDQTQHAGKLFDYLPTRKPILAITPLHGEVAKVILSTGVGIVIDSESPLTMQVELLREVERFLSGEIVIRPRLEAIELYSWPNLIGNWIRFTDTGCALPKSP